MENENLISINSKTKQFDTEDDELLNQQQTKKENYLNSTSQFVQKLIIQNHPSTENILYTLEHFLSENNYETDYVTDNEPNKLIILFYNDEIAYNFTKELNYEKTKNPAYSDINITLSIILNENYKPPKNLKKKKFLSFESIERLYKGETLYQKPNNKKAKTRRNFENIGKMILSNSYSNNNVISNIYFFFIFLGFGIPYKIGQNKNKNKQDDLSKSQRIGPLNIKFREVNKERWVSPTNFYV